MTIYCDLDGVLADFDGWYKRCFGIVPTRWPNPGNVDWPALLARPGWYADLPLMPDALELWNYIEPQDPIILTGIPRSAPQAIDDKRAWVLDNLSGHAMQRMICCRSSEKSNYCAPGDILIDDWARYAPQWRATGGRFILHSSAAETIRELKP